MTDEEAKKKPSDPTAPPPTPPPTTPNPLDPPIPDDKYPPGQVVC